MTNELKNALLKSNIQCINENDGKFVFFRAVTTTITVEHRLHLSKDLFSREIPVGSFLIAKVSENEVIKTLVFVCCNASQSSINKINVKNNLFWAEITDNDYDVVPL